METEKILWTWGPAAPFMVILLKILYDAVYVQIPSGFRGVREELNRQMTAADKRHQEHTTHQVNLEMAVRRLERKLLTQPRRKKPRRKRST